VWHKKGSAIQEQKKLAGIFFRKQGLTFYEAKNALGELFDTMKLSVSYHSMEKPEFPWFMPYQTATIMHEKQIIGQLGMIDPLFAKNICEGELCVFELDGDFLLSYQAPAIRVQPISKYPDVVRDISMFVPLTLMVDQLKNSIAAIDPRIQSVHLIDFFEKQEWADKRAVTMRYVIVDQHKTLTREEVDEIHARIEADVKKRGAVIR
jgi:phenylalanyl-tRNA synthetase beta subunit